MKVGEIYIDFESLEILSPSETVSVEPKVMAVLEMLIQNSGRVVSRSALIDAVWGVEHGADERLTRAISLLRKAFPKETGEASVIKTVPRRGYKFIASPQTPVEPCREEFQEPVEPGNQDSIPPMNKPIQGLPLVGLIVGVGLMVGVLGVVLLSYAAMKPPMPAPAHPRPVQSALEQVRNFAQKGAIFEAQDLLEATLETDPKHAAAKAALSLALLREYSHLEQDPALIERARSWAEAAYRLDEHLALASTALAWSYEFQGDYSAAHIALDRAEILAPDDIFMLEGRIRTLTKQGKWQEADKLLDRAIKLHPDDQLFHLYAGEIALTRSDFVAAEASFRNGLKLFEQNPRAHAQLAHSLHMQGRTGEAIQALQEGLQVNETPLLYNNLGTFLYYQGHFEMAAEAFEKTLSKDGDAHDYLYWANIADAYRMVPGQKDKANDAYDNAIKLLSRQIGLVPNNPTLLSRMSLYQAKRGHLDKARSLLMTLELNANSTASEFYRAAVVYHILSDPASSIKMLSHAISKGYPITEILNDPEIDALRQEKDFIKLIPTQEREL